MTDGNKNNAVETSIRRWLQSIVIDLNLCPFASRELINDRIRFVVTDAISPVQLLEVLETELNELILHSEIETTLLIHPDVLQNFYEYNEFLEVADQLLQQMSLEGVFQIASFHPDYQFSGTEPEDAENYTNRSPYPVLHLLREASLEQVIATTPKVDQIPERNIEHMKRLGAVRLKALLQACTEPRATNLD